MTDEIDKANDYIAMQEESALNAIKKRIAKQPVGVEGECELCGEWMIRLVDGACAPCRDKYKLP